MPGRPFDAVVVGGGPAGSCTAQALASRGAKVALLEREEPPRYKTCGGGVVTRALNWIPRGVAMEADRVFRSVELNLLDDGLHFSVDRSGPLVSMTMRSEFDLALLSAAKREGAEVRSRCAFTGIAERNGTLDISTSDGMLSTKFLVAADGAAGPVARASGWRDPAVGIPALECELTVDQQTWERFGSIPRFDFGQPTDGYAWVFPKRDHLSVGILRMRRGRASLKDLLEQYLERIGVERDVKRELHGFVIPIRPRSEGFSQRRTLLVGDSAGLADPVTGEGISYAIRSGQLAASAMLDGDFEPEAVRRRYSELLDRHILSELKVARMLARVLYYQPRRRAAIFRRFGSSFCEAVTEIILGQRTYRQLVTQPARFIRDVFPRFSGR
jgi:geranylgeranyl reductase family protein